ncbi:MAG: serine/threonine-protein kinase [Kiritimatiellia bacterium]
MNPTEPIAPATSTEGKTAVVFDLARRPIAPEAPAPALSSPSGLAAVQPVGSNHGMVLEENYKIQSVIGEGGMGIVYLATDLRLGRFVAVKRLRPAHRNDPALRSRFLREARTAARLNSAHIVHVYDIGEDAEGPFLVMEYVASSLPAAAPGLPHPPQTFERRILDIGTLSLRDSLSLLLKLGHAMETAHAAGVIHRDLKPANILMDADGEPKIADFGLAHLSGSAHAELQNQGTLTLPGSKLLSLGYGAPEQETDASQCDERTDIYGLGAILFFALTGKNPRFFREDEIPAPVRPLLAKALATSPDRRYTSTAAFDADIVALLADTRPTRPTKTTWRCKWCNTENAIDKRFCDGCGWDGLTICLECGAQMRFGIQFCGACGADQAAYEAAEKALHEARRAFEVRNYSQAAAIAAPNSFKPSGPSGQQLFDSIADFNRKANAALARLQDLHSKIPMDIQRGNYELALRHLKEEEKLCASPTEEMQKVRRQLPSILEKNALDRIEGLILHRQWSRAERLLQTQSVSTPSGRIKYDALRHKIRRHHTHVRLMRFALALAILFFSYLALAPFGILHSEKHRENLLWRPFHALATDSILAKPLTAYATACGISDLQSWLPIPSQLVSMERSYQAKLAQEKRAFQQAEDLLQKEYQTLLTTMRTNAAQQKDEASAKRLNAELQRFQRDRTFPEESFPIEENTDRLDFRNRAQQIADDFRRRSDSLKENYRKALQTEYEALCAKGETLRAKPFKTAIENVP